MAAFICLVDSWAAGTAKLKETFPNQALQGFHCNLGILEYFMDNLQKLLFLFWLQAEHL